MSDFSAKLKSILSGSAKFVGKTAASAAKSTKYKLNELSALSKRRELISDLGAKIYELSQAGIELPSEAQELVKQIAALDGNLDTMRADHAAQKAAAAEQHAAEKAARAAEKAAAKASAEIEKGTASVEVDLPEVESPVVEVEMPVEEPTAVPTLNVEAETVAEQPADDEVPTLNV